MGVVKQGLEGSCLKEFGIHHEEIVRIIAIKDIAELVN